jgi:hypothetical protein
LARQDQFKISNAQELDQMKKENANLHDELTAQKKATSENEAGKKNIICAPVKT